MLIYYYKTGLKVSQIKPLFISDPVVSATGIIKICIHR